MPGSDKTVDSGAIYISNTEPEYKAYVPYLSGNPKQLINGEQALVFARDRDTLANGNYGRAAHQREVMTELIKEGGAYHGINAYIPRTGYDKDEVFTYDEKTRKVIAEYWSKVKIAASNAN